MNKPSITVTISPIKPAFSVSKPSFQIIMKLVFLLVLIPVAIPSCQANKEDGKKMDFKVANIDTEFYYSNMQDTVLNDLTKEINEDRILYVKKYSESGRITIPIELFVLRHCGYMYNGDFEVKGDTIDLYLTVSKDLSDDADQNLCMSKIEFIVYDLIDKNYQFRLRYKEAN